MKLFISYSRDDGQWVYDLWRALQNEGHHDAWIDRKIVPATDWWATICKHIKEADCFVYVMSPKSVESIYCKGELGYALALNKPILPVMLKRCDFPQKLRKNRIQYQTVTPDMSMFQVLYKIGLGLTEVRVGIVEGRYPQNDLPYPDVPSPQRKPEHLYEVYEMAEEAVAEKNLTLAQQFYGQVIAADPDGLGVAAEARMNEIAMERDRETAYGAVERLAKNPRTRAGAVAAWEAFVRQYGEVYPPPEGIADDSQSWDVWTRRTASPADNAGVVPTMDTRAADGKNIVAIGDMADELTRVTRDIIGEPFAWVAIPAGRVEIGKHGWFDVAPFLMAKYPVTNAQFAKFVEAGGYDDKQWWGNGLWDVKWKEGWTEPRYWNDSDYNGANHPVVAVSWYEAIAFCNWLDAGLRATHGSPLQVMLPTEMQWQWAAQGDDGFEYPYGNTFDANKANTKESGIGKTTPVTQYEGKGDSPFGVVDMSGNVWEWCLNTYEDLNFLGVNAYDTARRVLRGGSFRNLHYLARVSYRYYYLPDLRYDNFGFRVCCVRPLIS